MQLQLLEKKWEKRKRNTEKCGKRKRQGGRKKGKEVVEGRRWGARVGGGALYTGGIFQSSADLKPLGDSFDFNLGCFFENYDRGPQLLH